VGPQYIVTHRVPASAPADEFFVDDFASALAQAKAAAGDKYVNVLGADIARQCLEAGELDEVLTLIAPVMLGDGTRLFDHPGGHTVALERLSATSVPLATNLWFRVT
jgi:dihydrofolate reductase